MKAIQSEVKKLIDFSFIREEQHPDWVANIVPVTKKNGKIRVCIDFRNLNKACPKDEFPLPITDVMIDNTCGFERMSCMDGFSGYNQIKMYPDDEKHTSFRTPLGVYCYTRLLDPDIRRTGISSCFLGSSSRSGRENTRLQPRLVFPIFAFEDNQKPIRDFQIKEALKTSTGPELRDWRFPYIDYALYSILPKHPKEAVAIRRKAPKFYYNAVTRTLYRRSRYGILLHCLSNKEAQETLKEAHDGMCGAHQPGPKLKDRL